MTSDEQIAGHAAKPLEWGSLLTLWSFYMLVAGETRESQPEAMTATIVAQASTMRFIAEGCSEGSQGIYPLDLET